MMQSPIPAGPLLSLGLLLSMPAALLAAPPADGEPAGEPKAETASDDGKKDRKKDGSEEPEKKLFTGKVVMLRDALQRRGIESREEFEGQVVLETPEGELIPIVPDWRGRAFYQDERLRNRKVDLVGYRREGVPYLQVLMIFTYDEKGRRMYTDYWCDICSIPMYEIKPCDCCQGPIRLRFQRRDLPAYLSEGSAGEGNEGPSGAGNSSDE